MRFSSSARRGKSSRSERRSMFSTPPRTSCNSSSHHRANGGSPPIRKCRWSSRSSFDAGGTGGSTMRRIGSGLRTRATVARWSAWAWVVLLSSCFTLKPQEKTRLLERRLEAAEVHGKKDPLRLASALNSLGLDRIQAGAYREAHELLAEALEIRQRELHPDHPFTAATRNILGWVLTEEGDYEHALPMLEQALRVNEKKLGK